MTTMFACFIAMVSTLAFIVLWFWVVRKELHTKRDMVEVARCQLIASKEQCCFARDDLEKAKTQEIAKRCHSVYRQAIDIYNQTLCKPWNVVPALVLGFRQKSE